MSSCKKPQNKIPIIFSTLPILAELISPRQFRVLHLTELIFEQHDL